MIAKHLLIAAGLILTADRMLGVQGKTVAHSMLKHSKDGKCDLKKADRCTQILYIYGDPSYKMSENVHEAEHFCKYVYFRCPCFMSLF